MIDVIAIDPGPKESGVIRVTDLGGDGKQMVFFVNDRASMPNDEVRQMLENVMDPDNPFVPHVAIEQVRSYGMAVGAEVFDTCVETGRFVEITGGNAILIPRMDVKMHVCKSPRAKDANIRQALIDRFGSAKKGGVLYGVTGHAWAALAVAVTAMDRIREGAKAA